MENHSPFKNLPPIYENRSSMVILSEIQSLLNTEIVHTWEDDNTSDQTCRHGRLLFYQNQEFDVNVDKFIYIQIIYLVLFPTL